MRRGADHHPRARGLGTIITGKTTTGTMATCTRDKLTREITPYLWVHPDEDR
jgi:hypothetical protein